MKGMGDETGRVIILHCRGIVPPTPLHLDDENLAEFRSRRW